MSIKISLHFAWEWPTYINYLTQSFIRLQAQTPNITDMSKFPTFFNTVTLPKPYRINVRINNTLFATLCHKVFRNSDIKSFLRQRIKDFGRWVKINRCYFVTLEMNLIRFIKTFLRICSRICVSLLRWVYDRYVLEVLNFWFLIFCIFYGVFYGGSQLHVLDILFYAIKSGN